MHAPILCRQFVGRATELELLAERFRLARTGAGSIVVLRGDAGIGKSRLLAELRARLEADNTCVFTGDCLDYACAPLGPFVDVLAQIAALEPADAAAYERPTAPGTAQQREDASSKRRQFIGIAATLSHAAQRRPTVVALEDLHWADHATLELLLFLSAKIASMPLLIVATYRGDDMHRRHPLSGTLSRIVRADDVIEIPLEPLTPSEMNALLRGALHDQSLDADAIAGIRRLAEGNPLFAEELLRTAVAAPGHGATTVPRSLRDVVLARLDLLPEDEQLILVQAAVLGREFDPALLAAITASPLGAVRTALKHARDVQLISERPGDGVAYRFRHELTREALSEELLTDERRALHAAVAAELETRAPEKTGSLAYHWWAASVPRKAIPYNVAAGDAAAHMCAFNDAAALYTRAIEFVHDAGRERAAIREKIAEASFHAGLGRTAARHFERALADYESCADREAVARICERMAYQAFWSCDGAGCVQWCERAAEAIRSVEESASARRVFATVARIAGLLGDLPRSLAYLAEAERAQESTIPDVAVFVDQARGLASAMMGDGASAIRTLRGATATSGAAADTRILTNGNLALVGLEFGDDAIAAAAQDEGLRIAREHCLPARELYLLGQRAEMHLRRGDVARAISTIDDAIPLREIVDFPGFMYIKLTSAALRLGMRLQRPALLKVFDAERMFASTFVSKGAEFIAEIAAAWTEKLIDEGRTRDAAALLHRAVAAVGDGISRATLLVLTAAHGDLDDVVVARDSLVRWARPNNVIGRAQLSLFDAHVARRNGDRAATSSHAAQAAALFATIARPYERAQALELAGAHAEAQALYASIGDVRDAERLRPLAFGLNRRGRAKDELTAREREVSLLVATGKSNRAIGAELVISERTVEKHLEAIMAKVGVASRTELAARIAQHES